GIVNVTDVGARKTWKRYPSYVITKAALESMTSMLARSLAPAIRVNAIAPGLILRSTHTAEEEWSALTARLPMRRPGDLDELTSALEFLIKNNYITGQTITVDGGYSLL
ncbi:MAG: SDR family oxidoreductase, partial [Chloroflexi bacterium]|nr:SDR family oxidoreductase [Chloroflexota bacterium]